MRERDESFDEAGFNKADDAKPYADEYVLVYARP